jgi:phage minor structural protein
VLNGAWELSLSHPIDQEGRWKYIVEEAVVKVPSFNGEQLWRIKQKKKADSGVTAILEPIFMDAMDDCFLVDVRPTNKNGQDALNIMTAPNSKYTGKSDITVQSTAYYQFMNLIEAINGDSDNSFINRWGGEILFDNYTVNINKRVGGDYGVQLRYGKNIPVDGLSEEVDIRDVVTRIYPKAYNGHTITNSGYIDSPLINRYPTIKAATITFEDVKMRVDAQEDDEANGVIVCDTQGQLDVALKEKCQEQYNTGIDKPNITISANMVLLQHTEQYKDYMVLEEVSLGDTIHCINNHLNIVTDARVIEMEYDSLRKKVISVVLGDFQYNYFNNVSSSVNRVDKAIRSDGSVIAEQVQGIIDGVAAQMHTQSSIAKKATVRAILFEDLDPQSSTFGAMCLGTMGFQIASERTADGRDWKWSTFGTGQGFFADFIVAGTMLAERIRGGTLEIGGATGKNGIISVLDASGVEIGRWDINGLNVKKGDIKGATITLGGANNLQGLLKLLNVSGSEIVRLDKDGVYAKGKYICEGSQYGRNVEISEGAFKMLAEDKTVVGMLHATSNKWMRLELGSGTAIGFTEDYLSFNAENIEVGGNIHVSGYMGKSGRAMFSDGSYLDFRKGFLVGGNTTEGGAF